MTDATVTEPTKLWFLLDRSGSMSALTQDVIGGFNTFVADQAQEPGTAHLTLVQFDSQAPFEVIHDAVRIDEVPPLTTDTYSPRGSTPLLDAIGQLIEQADQRIEARSRDDQPSEDQLVVILQRRAGERVQPVQPGKSDGVDQHQAGSRLGVRVHGRQPGQLPGSGTHRILPGEHLQLRRNHGGHFGGVSISRASREYRGKTRMERTRDSGQFYGGTREAETLMGAPGGRARMPKPHRGIPNLQRAAVGRPVTRLGISLFPVYLAANDLPEIATGPNSGLVIEELRASTVPLIEATNPTKRPVLIPEGEQLIGGLQDRVLNTSVLVAPSTHLDIPVSCLEQGRWGDRREFERGRAFAPRRTRRAKNASVADSIRGGRSRRSDQAAVWHAIDGELAHLGVDSRTRAVRDAEQFLRRDRQRAHAIRGLARRGPLPGQCGVAVTHGRRVVAIEVFGNHDLLVPHWEGLVRSHLLERPTANGRPSATRVLHRIRRFAEASVAAHR